MNKRSRISKRSKIIFLSVATLILFIVAARYFYNNQIVNHAKSIMEEGYSLLQAEGNEKVCLTVNGMAITKGDIDLLRKEQEAFAYHRSDYEAVNEEHPYEAEALVNYITDVIVAQQIESISGKYEVDKEETLDYFNNIYEAESSGSDLQSRGVAIVKKKHLDSNFKYLKSSYIIYLYQNSDNAGITDEEDTKSDSQLQEDSDTIKKEFSILLENAVNNVQFVYTDEAYSYTTKEYLMKVLNLQ